MAAPSNALSGALARVGDRWSLLVVDALISHGGNAELEPLGVAKAGSYDGKAHELPGINRPEIAAQ